MSQTDAKRVSDRAILLFRRVQRPVNVIGLGIINVLLDVFSLAATIDVVHGQVRH